MKPVVIAAGGIVLLSAALAYAAFTDVDSDGDGAISAIEFTEAFPDVETSAFIAADTNADGMLSEEEHVAAVEAGILPAD